MGISKKLQYKKDSLHHGEFKYVFKFEYFLQEVGQISTLM